MLVRKKKRLVNEEVIMKALNTYFFVHVYFDIFDTDKPFSFFLQKPFILSEVTPLTFKDMISNKIDGLINDMIVLISLFHFFQMKNFFQNEKR